MMYKISDEQDLYILDIKEIKIVDSTIEIHRYNGKKITILCPSNHEAKNKLRWMLNDLACLFMSSIRVKWE